MGGLKMWVIKITKSGLQEVAQLTGTTPYEVEITNLNPSSPLLCGHVKKKKKNTKSVLFIILVRWLGMLLSDKSQNEFLN